MSESDDSADRRAAVRRPCCASSCRLLYEASASSLAEVLDISPRGVGLLCEAPPQRHGLLGAVLTGLGSRISLGLLVRVAHVAELPNGRWLVGLAFVHSVPESVASLLL
jgi:hypothetical protein